MVRSEYETAMADHDGDEQAVNESGVAWSMEEGCVTWHRFEGEVTTHAQAVRTVLGNHILWEAAVGVVVPAAGLTVIGGWVVVKLRALD
jgi:hypothetical protein